MIVLAILLLSVLSAFQSMDTLYYRFVLKYLQASPDARHAVMLIETRPEGRHDWPKLARQLLDAGARQIVFVNPLGEGEAEALAAAGLGEKLLMGLPVEALRKMEGRARVPAALLAVPDASAGMLDRQFGQYSDGPRRLPTMEASAARKAGRPDIPDEFMLNFHRGAWLPRVGVERFEREPPLPELVAGRSLLVGYAASPYLARYLTPGAPGSEGMSQLEFHGLALDTLVQNKEVRHAGALGVALLLIGFSLVLILIFQPLRQRHAFWIAVAILVAMPPIAWAMLLWFDFWLPAAELSLLTVAAFLLIYRAKARNDDRNLRRLFNSTTSKLQNRLLPSNFAESAEHWSYVAGLVDQTLHLNRSLFLERIPGEHRVREVHALRCSINDLVERRRDYERFPYTAAMEERGMIEIDTVRRPFMAAPDPAERQFLVPLSFAGTVFGFWTFSLNPDPVVESNRFRATVASIAEQIGVLLYQRQAWQIKNDAEQQAVLRYFKDEALTLYEKLAQSIAAIERRLVSFESMFAALSTAAMTFDMFGRVLLVNDRMIHQLNRSGIAPYDMTVIDLLARLTGRDIDASRDIVQELIVGGTEMTLEADLPGIDEKHFLLSIRSLLADAGTTAESGIPFRSHGILLELIDVTEFGRLFALKSDVVRHVSRQIGNDLERLACAAQTLEKSAADGEQIVAKIAGLSREASERLERMQSLLAQDIDINFSGSYPLDPQGALAVALQSLQAEADSRNVRMKLDAPAVTALAYANPADLERTMAAIFRLLVDDAASGSEITIGMTPRAGHVDLEFRNTGFGIPQNRLDEMLSGDSDDEMELFDDLRDAGRRIRAWGGDIRIGSELGVGYVITVSLREFQ